MKKFLSITKKEPPDPGIPIPEVPSDIIDPGINIHEAAYDVQDQPVPSQDDIIKKQKKDLKALASSVRVKENNISSFTTVCMKLNSILQKGKKRKFKSHILEVVHTINRMTLLTYYFINLHIARIISEQGPIPSGFDQEWYKRVTELMPPLNDQNWYNVVCNAIVPINGTIKDQKDYETIQETYKVFKSLYPNSDYHIPDRQSLGQIQSAMNAQILWSVEKHVIGNMPKRINRYLQVCYKIDNPGLRKYMVSKIMNGPSDFESQYDSDQDAWRIIDTYRDIFLEEQKAQKVLQEFIKSLKAKNKDKDKANKKKTDEQFLEEAILEEENKEYSKKDSEDEKARKDMEKKVKKEQLSRYLLFEYQMLSKVEKAEGRKWTLLPHKGSFVDSHIVLAPGGMVDLLKSNCLEDKTKTRTYFEDMDSEIWNEVFRIPKNRGPYMFKEYMTTNGYSVSLNYRILPKDFVTITNERNYHELSLKEKYNVLTKYQKINAKLKKREASKQADKKSKKSSESNDQESNDQEFIDEEQRIKEITKLIEEDFTRCLGLDPGNRSLFTCVDKNDTSKRNKYGKILKCTNREYKHLTGNSKRTKEVNKRKDRVPILRDLGNNVSLKTGDYEKYKDNLKNLLAMEEEVLKEYQRLWYRKINFTGYQKKQKAFKTLAKRLQGDHEEEKVLIGWGNGGSGSNLKGSKVPVKGFRNYIEKNTKMKVVEINEDLTSKKCSKCGCDTKKMYEVRDLNAGKRRREDERVDRLLNEVSSLVVEEKRLIERIEKKIGREIEKKNKENKEEKGEVVINKKEYEVMEKKVEVYGVKQCVNCCIIWDRDVNASQNILKILLCYLRKEKRPTYLCRKEKEKPCTSTMCSVHDSQQQRGSIIPRKALQTSKRTLFFKKKETVCKT